jgi:hypothetical protein
MFNPQTPGTVFLVAAGKARRDEFMHEAERDRLRQKVKVTRSWLLARVLTGIGALLISIGEKLQDPAFRQGNYQIAGR